MWRYSCWFGVHDLTWCFQQKPHVWVINQLSVSSNIWFGSSTTDSHCWQQKTALFKKNKTYLWQLWSPTPSLAANGVHCFETPPSEVPSVSAASHPVQPLCNFYVHSSFSSSWSQMQSCKNIGLVLGASHTISPTKQYTCHPQPSAVKFNASLSRSVRFAIFAMLANHVATQIRVTKLLFYFTDARTGLWSCKLCTYCKPHGIRQYCGHNFGGPKRLLNSRSLRQ